MGAWESPGLGSDPRGTDLFRIVLVCTGNRCRSPVAEAILRREGHALPVGVRSLGLLDLGPVPTLPEIIELGKRHGLDMSEHRASHIQGNGLREEDLVLGLERQHVAAAVVEGGASYERTFTLREFVEVIEAVPMVGGTSLPAQAREMVAAAHTRRPNRFRPGTDIEDPFGGPPRGYEDMYKVVENLCRRLLQRLFGTGEGSLEVTEGRSV